MILAMKIGRYYTAGMAEDHDGLNNERFDEFSYLDQCRIVLRERRKMMELNLVDLRRGSSSACSIHLTGWRTCSGVTRNRTILPIAVKMFLAMPRSLKNIIVNATRSSVKP